MGILGRMNDIVRSNLNELVSKAENPEKMLKQAILDMEDHLRKARKQVLDTVAAEKTLEKKQLAILEQGRLWERRAEMALRASDEDLARQALMRKRALDDKVASLEGQIKVQREYVGALKQSLSSLEERLRDARTRKDALISRAQAAKARKKTAQAVSTNKSGRAIKEARAFDTFERMEDKVNELEAKAEAFVEMTTPESMPADDPALAAQFEAMENEHSVEAQLAELKAQISGAPKGED